MVITRFAPSPTGMLHIGGARVALFNFLFARHNNGKLMLRIEDTDVSRSTKENKDAILDGLKWLGIEYDDEVVYQSKRLNRHREVALQMVENGSAYFDYNPDTNVKEDVYRGLNRDSNKHHDGVPVRLRVPVGTTVVHDLIHGSIAFDNKTIDDVVLLRSDGTPTYMLAVVVDDIDMQISHVIRGDDHISNTPKQIMIYQSCSANVPQFAHIPLIHDISGQKMSKRRGAVGVGEYEELGYLPKAMINYIMQLGWNYQSSATESEIIDINEAIGRFDIAALGKSAACFDVTKLQHINMHYISIMPEDDFKKSVIAFLEKDIHRALTNDELSRFNIVLPLLRQSKTLLAAAKDFTMYLDDFHLYAMSEANDAIKENYSTMKSLIEFLINVDDLSLGLKNYIQEHGLKFNKIGPIVRALLVGRLSASSIHDIVSVFGYKESLRRMSVMLQLNNNE